MAVEARVREWHDEEGWGVVEAPGTPGGCWVHFSHLELAGYRSLRGVDTVELEFREVPQDGYRFTAVRVRVPGSPAGPPAGETPGGAYTSSLTFEFDDGHTVHLDGNGAVEWETPPAPPAR